MLTKERISDRISLGNQRNHAMQGRKGNWVNQGNKIWRPMRHTTTYATSWMKIETVQNTMVTMITRLSWYTDKPLSSSGQIATYLWSMEHRQHKKGFQKVSQRLLHGCSNAKIHIVDRQPTRKHTKTSFSKNRSYSFVRKYNAITGL